MDLLATSSNKITTTSKDEYKRNDRPSIDGIHSAAQNLSKIIRTTHLQLNSRISEKYCANVYLKREDLQVVRSYKIRGAYNRISKIPINARHRGVVCASAGNHAQGVAYSCKNMGINAWIFMPSPTPPQKIDQVRRHGGDYVQIILTGDSFDECYEEAQHFCNAHDSQFIHPFDDVDVIEGQATVGAEMLAGTGPQIDYLIFPIGGGGLASGLATYFKAFSPNTKLIGVEPEGAAAMKTSLMANKNTPLDEIDTFVDGAAVRMVGNTTFEICKQLIDDIVLVPEGHVCSTLLELHNQDAIIAEPAGALSISALNYMRDKIRGKTVACIVSGGNNDINRTEEIKERSLLFEGLKHYFIVNFPQRSGSLKDFLINILGPTDDIAHFEYHKKLGRERGSALVGIELRDRNDLNGLLNKMANSSFRYKYLNEKPDLLQYLL